MADDRIVETEEDTQVRNTNMREAISNAYAVILGEQSVKSFYAFTFEDALDNQIERIEGKSTKLRPNVLDYIDKVESDVLKVIEQLKALPPDSFLEPDPDYNVNPTQE